ncbi:MAG: hypothetical protein ABIH34_01695 [Nanoarchaeota archaeon]
MKRWWMIALLLLAACQQNIAGERYATLDECNAVGGELCSRNLYCTGQLFDSAEGMGKQARCCVLGECVDAVEHYKEIPQTALFLDTDQDCNVYAYGQGLITTYTSDLMRHGSYEQGGWVETAPIDVSNAISNPEDFSVDLDEYRFVEDGIVEVRIVQGVVSSRREGESIFADAQLTASEADGRYRYTLDGIELPSFFSSARPAGFAQQGTLSYFSDPKFGIVSYNQDTSKIVIEGGDTTDWPTLLTISQKMILAVIDRDGLQFFDTSNGFELLLSYGMSFRHPLDMSLCDGSLYILDEGRILKLDVNL